MPHVEKDDASFDWKQIVVVGLIIVVYVVLMIIGGVAMYAEYSPIGQANKDSPFAAKAALAVSLLVSRLRNITGWPTPVKRYPLEKSMFYTEEIPMNDDAIKRLGCPDTNGTCPSIEDRCLRDFSKCEHQSKNKCKPRAWKMRNDCVPVAACSEPSISEFRTSALHSKPVAEWMNMFRPNSIERYEVVTSILQQTVDRVTRAGFIHTCGKTLVTPPATKKYEICTSCLDRSEYIRCVMNNELIIANQSKTVQPYSFYGTNPEDILTTAIYDDRDENGNFIYQHWHLWKPFLTPLYDYRTGLAVKTTSGKTCEVCSDFDGRIYNRCFVYPPAGVTFEGEVAWSNYPISPYWPPPPSDSQGYEWWLGGRELKD